MSQKVIVKAKNPNGTISKVVSHHFQPKLTKKELDGLLSDIYSLADEMKQPYEKWTRHTSDLIRSMRDKAETFILAGGEPGLTQKDVAAFVWNVLEKEGISYDRSDFYKLFKPEQKRPWQSQDFLGKENTENHEHVFEHIGTVEGLGEIEKCGGKGATLCNVLRVDGRIHQPFPEEPPEPELKKSEPETILPKKYWPIIEEFQEAGDRMYDYAGVLKNNIINLTDEELKKTQENIFLMKKAGEFLDMAKDKKHLLHPFTMHLLALAYAESTQNYAGGLFIMYRLDLATRKHGEGVKKFKKIAEFSKLLSSKQTAKVMAGKVREINPRYEPKTEKDAQDKGFSGQQCQFCRSLRVGHDRVPNPEYVKELENHKDDEEWKIKNAWKKTIIKLMCFSCLKIPDEKVYSLPKEKPLVVVDWQS